MAGAAAQRFTQYVEDIGELLNMDVPHFPIIAMDMSAYCQFTTNQKRFLPAEIGIVAFDLSGKINDLYSSRIDPGEIPQGMMYNVRTAMKERGFEEPGFDPERQNFALIIDAALQLVKKHSPEEGNHPVFCFSDNYNTIYGCLEWMYAKAGLSPKRDPRKEFRLWSIELLLHKLSLLGFALRSAEHGVRPLNESDQSKKIRSDMVRRFGVGAMLTPLATGVGKGMFPLKLDPQNPAEQMLVHCGKICNEGHARDFLRASAPVKWWTLACPLHYEVACAEDCRIFSACAALNVQLVRERFRTALQGYFVNDA